MRHHTRALSIALLAVCIVPAFAMGLCKAIGEVIRRNREQASPEDYIAAHVCYEMNREADR